MNNWKIRLYRSYSSKLRHFSIMPLSRTLGNKLNDFAKDSILEETDTCKIYSVDGQ